MVSLRKSSFGTTVSSLFALLCAVIAITPSSDAADTVAIAAAADLQYCLVDLDKAFAENNAAVDLRISTGSSGNFTTQIKNGAPFDLFLSADALYPEELIKSGKAEASSRLTYAYGRIVLWTLHPDRIQIHKGLEVLKEDLIVHRIAIANPEHAPYGKAAKAALEKASLWEMVKDRIVLGDNIAQTAQFVDSGNAEVGIVALSLVSSPALKGKGEYQEIDPSLYPPLQQVAILTSQGAKNEAAQKYLRFLGEPVARAIFERYGFTLTKQNP
jgi:molybdate transport system substrate-binding protein